MDMSGWLVLLQQVYSFTMIAALFSHFVMKRSGLFLSSWMQLFIGLWATMIAVLAFAMGQWFTAGLNTVFAAFWLWEWWNHDDTKRRRRRLAERASGVVRDIGGRLKVVRPAPAGA